MVERFARISCDLNLNPKFFLAIPKFHYSGTTR